MILDANPSLLGDGLVYDSNDWLTIAQKGNKGAKHRFACEPTASTNDIVAPDTLLVVEAPMVVAPDTKSAVCHVIESVTCPPPWQSVAGLVHMCQPAQCTRSYHRKTSVLSIMLTLLVLGTCDEALGAINGV